MVKPNCSRLQKAGSANVELIDSGRRPVQCCARFVAKAHHLSFTSSLVNVFYNIVGPRGRSREPDILDTVVRPGKAHTAPLFGEHVRGASACASGVSLRVASALKDTLLEVTPPRGSRHQFNRYVHRRKTKPPAA